MEKKREIRDINSELPHDIIQLIFSKLPFFNLPNCRLVCETWNNLVLTCKFDSPTLTAYYYSNNFFYFYFSRTLHFVDMDSKHFKDMDSCSSFSLHHELPSGDINIINSCNGLVCLTVERRTIEKRRVPDAVYILNPMTNEYVELAISRSKSMSKVVNRDGYVHYFYGLGFGSKTKKFKLARISSFVSEESSGSSSTLVEIFAFTRSNREWTPVATLSCFADEDQHGVYVNGALYWLGIQPQLPHRPDVILRLDIESEKLEQIYFPYDDGVKYDSVFIQVFKGTLYLILCNGTVDLKYRVWKMEHDSSSWTKVFVLARPNVRSDNFQPIETVEDGKILKVIQLYDFAIERSSTTTDQDDIDIIVGVYELDSFNFNSLEDLLEG